MKRNLSAPEGLAGRGASAALRVFTLVSAPALHPLPLPANAAHAEYSDRLLGANASAVAPAGCIQLIGKSRLRRFFG
jgi:hypothetical protein